MGIKMTVKSRLLELLEQNKGEILSGEAIAAKLSCTRAAVWKAVKALREEGYTIEAWPNKGYTLSRESNLLSEEGVRLYLKKTDVQVKVQKEVDSTNQEARREAIGNQAPHGSVVLAGCQTAGRGRRGRDFFSPKDAGLYMSVILRPEKNLQQSLLLTTAAAAAVYKAVRKVCGIALDIKWVNDLYLEGRKVCGILTEAATDFESGNIEFAVVGIGVNLYQEPEHFPEELREIAGALYPSKEQAEKMDRNLLAAEIVNELLAETADLKLSKEYVERNMIPGKIIRITDQERSRKAKALEICPDGRLKVLEEDGSESVLSYGEVSVCIDK